MFFLYVVKANVENVMKNSGWFYLEKVSLNGLRYVPQEAVLKRLPEASSASIFSLNLSELKEKIEKDPRLEVLSIKTRLPDELIIDLKEIYGDYIVLLDEKDYYDVTKDMRVLAMNDAILNYDKLVFCVSSEFLRKMEVGFDARFSKNKEIREGQDLIEKSSFLKTLFFRTEGLVSSEKDFLSLIGSVNLNDEAYIEMYLRNAKQKIVMDATFKPDDLRRARYAYLYAKSDKLGKGVKAIDVREAVTKYVF